jgi:Co/Zn/Cd efflux system component
MSAEASSPSRSRTVFAIPKMDCPSEEGLIRMALQDMPDVSLSFDLTGRRLTAVHPGSAAAVLERLAPLGLGAAQIGSEVVAVGDAGLSPAGDAAEARTLAIVLGINAVMFLVEGGLGLLAQSTGLVADSLDMFADAVVYGVALVAVGRAASQKLKAAHLAGWLQVLLALGVLFEVGRRTLFGSEPMSGLMMGVGLLALVANLVCLVLVARQRDRGAHMKASTIFSANDVLANAGVMVAGLLVAWTGSSLPDLVIGAVISALVLQGARRILALR